MRYFILISLLVLLFGNCTEPSQKEEKKDKVIIECQKILKDWNIVADVSIENQSKESKIFIDIKQPTITNKDHASIIISCLIAKHSFLPPTENIIFNISSFVNNTKSQLNEVTYNQEHIKSLTTLYKDAPLLRLNEYCIKNFDRNTAYEFENLMTKNHKLEKWALEGSFYQLLYQFFKESKGYEKNQNASLTMFFLFLTTSDFLKGTDLENHSKHISELWKIARNENIKDAEKEFIEIINSL